MGLPIISGKDSGGNVTLGGLEAIFLTGKLIDRQDFIRNLLHRSYFSALFAVYDTFIKVVKCGKTNISLVSWCMLCNL